MSKNIIIIFIRYGKNKLIENNKKEEYNMCKNSLVGTKCLILGIIMGFLLTCWLCYAMKNQKQVKRKATKAVRSMESLLGNVEGMIK